jgi:hypothetical protein
MKKLIKEAKRMQQLAGLLKETALEEDNRPQLQQDIDAVLAKSDNPELDIYIEPVKSIIDNAFAEDAVIDEMETELRSEIESQLQKAESSLPFNEYATLRYLFQELIFTVENF